MTRELVWIVWNYLPAFAVGYAVCMVVTAAWFKNLAVGIDLTVGQWETIYSEIGEAVRRQFAFQKEDEESDYISELESENLILKEDLQKYQQAIGLATTLKGDLVMDADDPVGMVKAIIEDVNEGRAGMSELREMLSLDKPSKSVVAIEAIVNKKFVCVDSVTGQDIYEVIPDTPEMKKLKEIAIREVMRRKVAGEILFWFDRQFNIEKGMSIVRMRNIGEKDPIFELASRFLQTAKDGDVSAHTEEE